MLVYIHMHGRRLTSHSLFAVVGFSSATVSSSFGWKVFGTVSAIKSSDAVKRSQIEDQAAFSHALFSRRTFLHVMPADTGSCWGVSRSDRGTKETPYLPCLKIYTAIQHGRYRVRHTCLHMNRSDTSISTRTSEHLSHMGTCVERETELNRCIHRPSAKHR